MVSLGNTGFQPSQTDIKCIMYELCGMPGLAILEVRAYSPNSGNMNVWLSQAGFFLSEINCRE